MSHTTTAQGLSIVLQWEMPATMKVQLKDVLGGQRGLEKRPKSLQERIGSLTSSMAEDFSKFKLPLKSVDTAVHERGLLLSLGYWAILHFYMSSSPMWHALMRLNVMTTTHVLRFTSQRMIKPHSLICGRINLGLTFAFMRSTIDLVACV